MPSTSTPQLRARVHVQLISSEIQIPYQLREGGKVTSNGSDHSPRQWTARLSWIPPSSHPTADSPPQPASETLSP